MTEIDYEELFRSPLDDIEGPGGNRWAPTVAGLLCGILAALLIALVLGDQSDPAPVSSTVAAVLPPQAGGDVNADYPPDFVELAPGFAARPTELLLSDESITLAFTAAAKRGADPLEPIWPLGGVWWLEVADGSGAESSRVILDRFSPGVFAVRFPAEPFAGGDNFARVRMIERWDQDIATGTASVAFAGEPFVLAEPLTIPVTQDVTLIVERLELGRFLGRVDWAIEGPDRPRGRVVITVTLLDSEQGEVGTFATFPELLDPAAAGTAEILWQEPFPTSQEGAVTAVIEYSIGLVEVVATDVAIELDGVAVERWRRDG